METILLLFSIFLLIFVLYKYTKKEPFLVPIVYSTPGPEIFDPFLLEDEYSPYVRFDMSEPILSGETYQTVAAQYSPFYNNSDVAKSARGWTLPTEGTCIPNELCGRFYLRRKVIGEIDSPDRNFD